MQELARRTVGIFHYPKGSALNEVKQHADNFGRQFGQVLHSQGKRNINQNVYAILNFETPGEAQAALAPGSKPIFKGVPEYVLPWKIPGKAQVPGAAFKHSLTIDMSPMPS